MKSRETRSDLRTILPPVAIFTAVITIFMVFIFCVEPIELAVLAHEGIFISSDSGELLYWFTGKAVEGWYMYPLLVLAGAIMAALAFSFCFSKATVNVVMSSPVKRRTLFLNRTVPSLLGLFAGVFLPLTVTLVADLTLLDGGFETLKAYAALLFSFFLSELLGFSFAVFAIGISGSIAEFGAITGMLAALPSVLVFFVQYALTVFLRGFRVFSHVEDISASPFSVLLQPSPGKPGVYMKYWFINPLLAPSCRGDGSTTLLERFRQCNSGGTMPNIENSEVLTLAVWYIIGLFFILLAASLFSKKRFENAGISGNSKRINLLFGSFLGFGFCTFILREAPGVSTLVYPCLSTSRPVSFALLGVGGTVIFLLIYLILLRNDKKRIKPFIMTGAAMCAVMALPVILALGGLGAETRVPKPDNVKRVICTVPSDSNIRFGNYGAGVPLVFSSAEDIEKVCELHKTIARNNGDFNSYITVVYELSDGSFMTRCYGTSRREDYYALTSLYMTDGYADYVERLLTGIDEAKARIPSDATAVYEELSKYFSEITGAERVAMPERELLYLDFISPVSFTPVNGVGKMSPEGVKELKKLIVEDLREGDEASFFGSTPLGKIAFKEGEYNREDRFYESDPLLDSFFIYPSMKKTVVYLTEHDLLKYFSEPESSVVVKAEITDITYDTIFVTTLRWGMRYSDKFNKQYPSNGSAETYYASRRNWYLERRDLLAHAYGKELFAQPGTGEDTRLTTPTAEPVTESEVTLVTDRAALDSLVPKLVCRGICLNGSYKYVIITFSDGYALDFLIKAEDVPA